MGAVTEEKKHFFANLEEAVLASQPSLIAVQRPWCPIRNMLQGRGYIRLGGGLCEESNEMHITLRKFRCQCVARQDVGRFGEEIKESYLKREEKRKILEQCWGNLLKGRNRLRTHMPSCLHLAQNENFLFSALSKSAHVTPKSILKFWEFEVGGLGGGLPK